MSGTSNPISFDKQFRCHIFGWALGATLIPHIFKKVNDKVKEDYTQVVETHGIDVQGPQSPLKRWPADFHWKFDYKNINGNREASRDGKSDHSLLNYNVSNHVDFARLYVGQHAAEDITFNGDSDPRPLLCVIAHGPFFSAAACRAARYLMDARDDWAHFLYSKWNLEKFNRCFKELEQLVVEMDLCSEVQKKVVGQIDMWQTIEPLLLEQLVVEMDLCSEVQKKLVGQIDMWQTIGTRLQFDFVNPADLQTIREDIKSLQHGLQKFTTEQENRSATSKRRLDDLEAYQQKALDSIRSLEGSHKRRRTEVTEPGKVDHPRTHLKEPQPVATADLVPFARLPVVQLAGYNLGDDDAQAVAKILKQNRQLKSLDLSDNCIGDLGAVALAASLKGKTFLEKVDLSRNKIYEPGIVALRQAFQDIKGLNNKSISLEYNYFV